MAENHERPVRQKFTPARFRDAAKKKDLDALDAQDSMVSRRRKADAKEGPGPIGVDLNGEPVWEAECVEQINDKDEAYVKYTGWGAKHNEWVPFDALGEKLLAQALKLRALEGKTSNVIDSIPPLMINVNVTQEDTEQAQQTQPVAPTAPAEPFVGLPFIASTAQNEANFDRCITEVRQWCATSLPFLPSQLTANFLKKRFLLEYMSKAKLYLGSDASSHCGDHPLKMTVMIDDSEFEILPTFVKTTDKVVEFEASQLDEWLGGDFWRYVGVPSSKHCAIVFPQTKCKFKLTVETQSWCSHTTCPYCTFAVGFCLDDQRPTPENWNPLFLLAGSPKFPTDLACQATEKAVMRYFVLSFETTRHVILNTMYFRKLLREKQLETSE